MACIDFYFKKKERKEKKNYAETSEVDYIPVINNCFNSHDREAPPFRWVNNK